MSFKIPIYLFTLSFVVYFFFWFFLFKIGKNSFTIQSGDTVPATYLPVSILKEGNFYLDEYYPYFKKHWPDDEDANRKPYYLARSPENKIISAFPVFNSLVSLPLYLPVLFLNVKPDSPIIYILGHASASFYCALASVIVFLCAFELTKSLKKSFIVYFAFAFASINFALLSQTMWQHGFTSCFLALSLLFILKGERNKNLIKWAGLTLSLAVLIRPTMIIPALLFTVYVFIKHRAEFIKFVTFALLPIPIQLWYANTYMGSPFKNAYESQLFINWKAPFPEGFLGLWLSPSKGILAYSPQFIFSLFSCYLIFSKKKIFSFSSSHLLCLQLSAFCLLLFTLLMGKWVHWYGGWGFGYRMASDMLPILALLLVPFLMSPHFEKLKYIFYVTLGWGFMVELMGMIFDFRHWHTLYDNGPSETRWLWSFRDSEIAYYLRTLVNRLK